MEKYKVITVKDLAMMVADARRFPKGMNTPILTGDFEGNYTHLKHEIMFEKINKEKCIFLGYEMHENMGS